MIATAPGKLILTGEYAVLGGASALVLAVDRRVRATIGGAARARGSAPFVVAVADAIARELGANHPAAAAALTAQIDSSALFDAGAKLGLGSSAAVSVAVTAAALAGRDPRVTASAIDRALVWRIASTAHANAQGERGARGSGADVAAAVYGGAIAFKAGQAQTLRWPTDARLVTFFGGTSADTATLVRSVNDARTRAPAAVDAALAAIASASAAACAACAASATGVGGASALIAALVLAGHATDRLALATGVPIVPPAVVAVRQALATLGGAVKTTGAGGGDVAVAVIPATMDVTIAHRAIIQAGCRSLDLALDPAGVDLRAADG